MDADNTIANDYAVTKDTGFCSIATEQLMIGCVCCLIGQMNADAHGERR